MYERYLNLVSMLSYYELDDVGWESFGRELAVIVLDTLIAKKTYLSTRNDLVWDFTEKDLENLADSCKYLIVGIYNEISSSDYVLLIQEALVRVKLMAERCEKSTGGYASKDLYSNFYRALRTIETNDREINRVIVEMNWEDVVIGDEEF